MRYNALVFNVHVIVQNTFAPIEVGYTVHTVWVKLRTGLVRFDGLVKGWVKV